MRSRLASALTVVFAIAIAIVSLSACGSSSTSPSDASAPGSDSPSSGCSMTLTGELSDTQPCIVTLSANALPSTDVLAVQTSAGSNRAAVGLSCLEPHPFATGTFGLGNGMPNQGCTATISLTDSSTGSARGWQVRPGGPLQVVITSVSGTVTHGTADTTVEEFVIGSGAVIPNHKIVIHATF